MLSIEIINWKDLVNLYELPKAKELSKRLRIALNDVYDIKECPEHISVEFDPEKTEAIILFERKQIIGKSTVIYEFTGSAN